MKKVAGVDGGGSALRKIGQNPTRRSFDFQARSSIELARKFKQVKQDRIIDKQEKFKEVKQEKIDKLHERLQGNNREKVQEVHIDLDKNVAAKKMERLKVNQNVPPSQRIIEKNMSQPEAMEGFDESTMKIGISKKRTRGNDIDEVQEVNGNLGKNKVAKKVLIPSAESQKQDQQKLSFDTIISKTQCSKKQKKVPTCPSMMIDDYIQLQKSKEKDATKSLNGEKTLSKCHPNFSEPIVKVKQNQPPSRTNREKDFIQHEVMEDFAHVGDINQEEVTVTNKAADEGTSKKRTRGKTLCKGIHARTMEEREVVTFNDDGQPIGPTDRAVSNLSLFLGTLARNSTFCPLIYTNWSYMPDQNIKRIWKYTNQKFILPDEALAWVRTTVRDAWRRYKTQIKKNHFSKYPNMTQRLKHCPPKVPEPHFRKLCEYWSFETIQAISNKNTQNRARQKWRHRMGPINFGRVREKVRAKEKKNPSQGVMFVETRKGNKGKQLDGETEDKISQLQDLMENYDENDVDAFQVVFGKEHPGMVHCYGRNVTRTSLKRKAEINALKEAHNEEVASLNERMHNMESRFQDAIKAVLQHCKPEMNIESLEELLALSPKDANSTQKVTGQPHIHSSASTHDPDLEKKGQNGGYANDDEELEDDDDAF